MEGEIGGSLDISAFNPREAWLPFLQIPTQFTDGAFTLKPWRSSPVRLQNFGGINVVECRSTDNNTRIKNGADFLGTDGHPNRILEGPVQDGGD